MFLPIIITINRIQDDEKSFDYTRDLIEEFKDNYGLSFDKEKLILTHLRNSYYIYDTQDIYLYFLDAIKSERYIGEFEFSKENDFNFFKQCIFKSIMSHNKRSKVDYLNPKLYDPDKDMITFRVNFLPIIDTEPPRYKHNFDYFDDSYFKNGNIPYCDKLIKDTHFQLI